MKVFETLERQRNWSEDERLVLDQVRRVAGDIIAPKAAEIDRTGEFPWDNVRALNAIGANAIFVPAAYGGLRKAYPVFFGGGGVLFGGRAPAGSNHFPPL